MPPSYVTPEGLEIETVEEIQESLATEQRATIDPLINTSSKALQGQHNGIFASHLREVQEVAQIAWDAQDPNAAEESRLEVVCAITGTKRNPATPSRFKGTRPLRVTLEPSGGGGAQVIAGVSEFRVAGTSITFIATKDVENTGGVNATFDVEAECTVTGPTPANANTVTEVGSAITGFVSVNNPFDVILGSNRETDQELRARRESELKQAGACTMGTLVADLLALEDDTGFHPIRSAQVIENTTDFYDPVTGLPPHSFEALIWDGPGAEADNDAVAAIVLKNTPLGIPSRGAVTGSNGAKFSRPAQVNTSIRVTLKFLSGQYAGDPAVESAIAAAFAAQQAPATGSGAIGVVAFSDYLAIAMAQAGVARVTLFEMALAPSGFSSFTDLQPGPRQVAVTDTSLITIISSAE